MSPLDIFLNRQERLRSGWRLLLFACAYFAIMQGIALVVFALVFNADERAAADFNRKLGGPVAYLLQFLILFVPALALGWAFGKFADGVPLRAIGWTLHRGWVRDLLLGSVLGFAALALAAAVATAAGGFRFAFAPEGFGLAFVKTFAGALLVYLLLAAGEEVAFRGYPLQTLMRSHPVLLAALPTSVLFAAVHLANPNVPRDHRLAFMFGNTVLAGVWLAVAYWRTRSLWLPLGLHWSWNWAMGSVLGLPVSGITSLNRAPLVRATDAGPDWLTGGSYGIEGGAACTVALLAATIFVWRTRLLSADEELKRFTDGEQPKNLAGDTGASL